MAAQRAAGAPRLLVSVDFDGTIAPLVDEPRLARPLPGAWAALARLARLPGTVVALVSGRSLADLRAVADPPALVRLVGSHGAEFDGDGPPRLDRRARLLIAELAAVADAMTDRFTERKPTGVAVHWGDPAVGDRFARYASGLAGIQVRRGRRVVEASLHGADKGTALERLRWEADPDTVVHVGDDQTDEDAFACLGPRDVGIRVGPGPTRAGYRLAGPEEVAGFLADVHRLRAVALQHWS